MWTNLCMLIYCIPLYSYVGGLYFYTLLFVTLMWLCHTSVFFWGVVFPIHYRMFTSAGKMKYLHAIVVPIVVVLPIISLSIIRQSGGYGVTIYGYYFCRGLKANDVFYGVVVPLNTMSIICTSLLIIITWNIVVCCAYVHVTLQCQTMFYLLPALF